MFKTFVSLLSGQASYISKISRPKRAVDHVSWRGENDFTWYLIVQVYPVEQMIWELVIDINNGGGGKSEQNIQKYI